jgi:NAD-dependent deacetylase
VSSAHDRLAGLIRSARSVVALTGAGVSVPSGIPDFRSPGTGLWENVDPMEVAHIAVWRRDPARFWAFYGQRFALLEGKRPNGAHYALAELDIPIITQNIDGLHAAAGSGDVIEIHGSIATASCQVCGEGHPLAETRARLEAADDGVPRCDCGEPLKPDVTLFGELLDEAAMTRASALAAGADLMLCVGSSLEVYPAAGLPDLTLDAGGQVAVITKSETPFDGVAAVRLDGDVEEEMRALVAALADPSTRSSSGPQRGLEPPQRGLDDPERLI